MRTLLLLTLCSTATLAIAPGGELYVRSKDTALLKEPRVTAAKVLTVQQGAAVVWLGPSDKDKRWHQVSVDGKKGFVLLGLLTPHKPQLEVSSTEGKVMDPAAFASSGAAVKDGLRIPRTYRGPKEATAAAELIYVEALNQASATPAALRAKDKELFGP